MYIPGSSLYTESRINKKRTERERNGEEEIGEWVSECREIQHYEEYPIQWVERERECVYCGLYVMCRVK